MSLDRLAALRGLRPERVCLIKPSSLGDVVHALPVLSSLRDTLARRPPRLGREPRAPGPARRPSRPRRGDPLRPLEDEAPAPAGWRSISRFLLDLRRRRFDLAIDLQGSAPIGRDGPGDRGAGPGRAGRALAKGRGISTPTGSPRPGPKAHAVDRLLRSPRRSGRTSRSLDSGSRSARTIAHWADATLEGRPSADGWRSTSAPAG